MKISSDDFIAISEETVKRYTEEFPEFNAKISIEKMNIPHIQETKTWGNSTHDKDGYGCWDWAEIFYPRNKKSKYLNYTITFNGVVEGMVSCRIEEPLKNVAIEYLQRKSGDVNLKGRITALAIIQAAMVGYAYEFKTVSINRPAPKLVDYYQKHVPSFTVVYENDFSQAVARLVADISEIVK